MAFGITPWDPFREFDRMERLFRRGFEGLRGGAEPLASPAVEVTDEGDHYLVRAELPGVKEDDVEITLTGNVLSIRGEKRYEKREGGTATTVVKPKKQEPSQQASARNVQQNQQQSTELTRTEEENTDLARPLYSEVYYGRFERTLTLPDDIDTDKVDAWVKNGVYYIEVGKKEEHRAKRINITRH